MKKIWILVLCLALAGVGFYFASQYLFYDISLKGVVPAIRTPGRDVKQYLPQNSALYYPFRVRRGYVIDSFANLGRNLPRAMAFDANDTLLVSSTTQGKVLALPDTDKNGKADNVIEVLTGLNKPHGIAFNGDELYVAETNKVVKYSYNPSDYTAGLGETVLNLPGGGRHFTRTIRIFNNKLYISVGSSCDVCIESEPQRAAILVSNLDGTDLKVFAKGLRNTVFFAFDGNGTMWGVDMGRDGLGDALPPDELNIISEGKDYGWPYCYGNRVRDSKFMLGKETTYCSSTETPIYNFPAHVAPLGLAFINSPLFEPQDYGNLFVSLHGSSESTKKVGYKVVYVSTYGGSVGTVSDYLTGFLQKDDILGRPVDLIFDTSGSLYISDDYSGLIYIYKRG